VCVCPHSIMQTVCVRARECLYVWMYIHIHMYIHIYMHTYIHAYFGIFSKQQDG